MPTLYVSKTGDDTSGDGTEPLPYLTLEKAISVSSNDDTILMGDGTYDCDDNATIATRHDIAVSTGLTIDAINEYQVTLVNSNANTSRCVYIQNAATGVTFGKIIIDGTDNKTNTVDSATGVTAMTFNGTYIRNGISNGLITNCKSVTMKNGWHVSGNMAAYAIRLDMQNASTDANIYDGFVTMPAMTSADAGGIRVYPTQTGVTANIYNNTLLMGIGSGTNYSPGVDCEGVTTLAIYNNTITNSGSSGSSVGGISVENDAQDVVCSKLDIYNNTINLGTTSYTTPEAHGIIVGNNSDPTTHANKIDNANIYGNSVVGCNHGILLGWVTGARVTGNTTNTTAIGVVSKEGISCIVEGNTVINPKSQGLYDKGGTGNTFGNNTVIAETATEPTSGMLAQSTNAAVESTGCTFSNNICYATVEIVTWVNAGTTVSTDTFNNNNFYSTVADPTTPFSRNATPYETVALWEAGVATGSDNTAVDPGFNTGYNLSQSSALVGAGTKWWTGANPVGADGEPFSDWDTDLGGIQSTHSPFHPKNL